MPVLKTACERQIKHVVVIVPISFVCLYPGNLISVHDSLPVLRMIDDFYPERLQSQICALSWLHSFSIVKKLPTLPRYIRGTSNSARHCLQLLLTFCC